MSVYAILSLGVLAVFGGLIYKFYKSDNSLGFVFCASSFIAVLVLWVYAINAYHAYPRFTKEISLKPIEYSISKTPTVLTVSRLGENSTTTDKFIYKNISDTSKVEVVESLYYNHYGHLIGKDLNLRKKE